MPRKEKKASTMGEVNDLTRSIVEMIVLANCLYFRMTCNSGGDEGVHHQHAQEAAWHRLQVQGS